MQYYNMYLVNAFTNSAFNGNATGVIISANKMNYETMQNTAKDLNQSVSVFVNRLDIGLYSTKFFTAKREIKLCGHATIATFFALAENEYIQPKENGILKIMQHTQLGKIPVEIEYFNSKVKNVYMNLNVQALDSEITDDEILKGLNINKEDLGLNGAYIGPKKISTGGHDIVIPVQSVEVLEKIKLEYDYMQKLSEKDDIISFQIFTIEELGEVTKVRQRTFSPSICVEEEAGSGTSTGATLYYINKYVSNKTEKIESTQGVEMGRTSCLSANMTSENTVRVGGRAFVFMNGVLNI